MEAVIIPAKDFYTPLSIFAGYEMEKLFYPVCPGTFCGGDELL